MAVVISEAWQWLLLRQGDAAWGLISRAFPSCSCLAAWMFVPPHSLYGIEERMAVSRSWENSCPSGSQTVHMCSGWWTSAGLFCGVHRLQGGCEARKSVTKTVHACVLGSILDSSMWRTIVCWDSDASKGINVLWYQLCGVPKFDKHAAGFHKMIIGGVWVHVCYINGYVVILMLKHNWHVETDISWILFLWRRLSLDFKRGDFNKR